jgi:predicted unusual protein kinase regulating ubiquinone biosynthesis (AarF/ABC1/UbiB family)
VTNEKHAPTLTPASLKKVVVKIQRPGLKSLFDIDLKNVRALAVWLQKVDPKTDGAARDWVAIYDECSRILYQVAGVAGLVTAL